MPLRTQSEARYEAEQAISQMWRDTWHIIAVRTECFKYIWNNREPNRPELFDLQADSAEQHNLWQQYPAKVKHFHEIIDAQLRHSAQTKPANAVAEPELDEAVVNRLRDLGYIE